MTTNPNTGRQVRPIDIEHDELMARAASEHEARVAAEQAAADRTAEGHRLALSEALGLGTGAPWDAIRARAADLSAGSAPATDPTAPELTAEEARDLVDELGTDLYRAQDALAFVEECCVIADRGQRPVTTADVREWLKGARCGRQLARDSADRADIRQHVAEALEHGPVRCPLCPTALVLRTPDGARAHFEHVHPEQQSTGRGSGPWPMLVDRAGLRARAAADALVANARRAVHEALVTLPAGEGDRIPALLADLETAVEERMAMWSAALPAPADHAAVRAEAEPPLSPDYQHPECGFHRHGKNGMDIPMRDGQPVCPRCALTTARIQALRDAETKIAAAIARDTDRTHDGVGDWTPMANRRLGMYAAERIVRRIRADAEADVDSLRRLADETPQTETAPAAVAQPDEEA